MAQARQAVRQLPHTAVYLAAALIAAVTIGVVVALGMLGPMRLEQPATDRGQLSPALIQAGRDWQLQREQQGGFVDPLTQAGRDWETQRKQQSGTSH